MVAQRIIIFILLVVFSSCKKRNSIVVLEKKGENKIIYSTDKNGSQIGVVKRYNSIGQLESEAEMTNFVPNGKFITYYSNGNIKGITHYKNNVMDGVNITFEENGVDTIQITMYKGGFPQ